MCVLLQAILCIANDHVRYNHQGPVLAHSRHENLSLNFNALKCQRLHLEFDRLRVFDNYSSLSIRDHRTTPHFSLLSENHSARARRTAPIPWTHPSELYNTPWLSVPTRTRLHTSRALSTYTPKQTYNPPHPHQSLTLLERTHVLIRSDDIITVCSALALSLSRAQRSCLSDSSGRTPRLCPGTASR